MARERKIYGVEDANTDECSQSCIQRRKRFSRLQIVRVEEIPPVSELIKNLVMFGAAFLIGLLLLLFAVYAMITSDQGLLAHVLWLTTSGFFFVLAWASGRKTPLGVIPTLRELMRELLKED